MILQTLLVGPLGVNCYIIADEPSREAFIVDPGGNGPEIIKAVQNSRLRVIGIVNTHAHFDHILALDQVRAATHAPFLLHADELPILDAAEKSAGAFGMHLRQPARPDRLLHDGDELKLGSLVFKVLHTPGHTPGGICVLEGKNVFVGDTLFQGSIGRTDLPGGDFAALMGSIRDKLFPLSDDTVVYPGHGPASTIGEEKALNPFLRPLITGRWNV